MFGRTGAFTWEDACSLVIEHPLHASFFVAKLWSYFVPTPPPAGVAAALERAYVGSGHQIRPVLEAILRSPQLYEGPRMVKPPVVQLAGMLRALGAHDHRRGVGVAGRGRRAAALPPAGRRGLGRQALAGLQHDPRALGPRQLRRQRPHDRPELDADALPGRDRRSRRSPPRARSGSNPRLEPETVAWLRAYAEQFQPPADTASTPQYRRQQRARLRAQRQNALRHLIAVSADYQTS